MKKSLHEYRLRRDFLAGNLAERFPGIIDFKVPDGGLAIWAKFHPSVPLPPLSDKLRSQGVVLSNGLIHNSGPISFNATRMGFAWMTIDESAKALDILEKTIKG